MVVSIAAGLVVAMLVVVAVVVTLLKPFMVVVITTILVVRVVWVGVIVAAARQDKASVAGVPKKKKEKKGGGERARFGEHTTHHSNLRHADRRQRVLHYGYHSTADRRCNTRHHFHLRWEHGRSHHRDGLRRLAEGIPTYWAIKARRDRSAD